MRRGKLEGGFIMLVLGAALGLLYNLVLDAVDDRLDARLIGVVLAMSTWFEQPKGER